MSKVLPFPDRPEMTPAMWAQLHAGIEFIAPAWERDAMIFRSRGVSVEALSDMMGKDPVEIERALGRVARTLATWERNACKWSTRFVAREPWAQGETDAKGTASIADAAQPKRTRRPLRGRAI